MEFYFLKNQAGAATIESSSDKTLGIKWEQRGQLVTLTIYDKSDQVSMDNDDPAPRIIKREEITVSIYDLHFILNAIMANKERLYPRV